MDNDTKLSPEQIKNLLTNLKSSDKDKTVDINDFASKNLNERQAQMLKNAMKNPKIISAMMSSPQIKQLIEKLKGAETEDES
ncbi:MAG: hypothetical protein NC122_00135 [Faecalibacterium sp.]|nr:hypothetical protein [Ruminococcus sp.]MCM1391388.1 hypothetical protein [Ruminococcus sp.]MCM1484598.1 hypothetical protein [Faecalibacterium sp.]